MKELETLVGNGTVTTPSDGNLVNVGYRLTIYQNEISNGLGGTIPGLQAIRGVIKPHCGVHREKLTLQMKDGRKIAFVFTDPGGNVTAMGSIC